MDMYFETASILTPLLTNFAVAVFTYEYFYIAIMIVNFILIYQYIGISSTSLP